MLHVFNGPIEPTSLAEFEKAKGESVFTGPTTKRKITYLKDGRRLLDGKIENEQSVSSLWSTFFVRTVAHDLKSQSDEKCAVNKLGFIDYVSSIMKKKIHMRNDWITYILIAINIILILLFLLFFIF